MTETLNAEMVKAKQTNGLTIDGFNIPKEDCRKIIPVSETNISYIDLDMTGLPKEADSRLIKTMFFNNQHVVEAIPEVDNMTGNCTGKAKIKVRCQDK